MHLVSRRAENFLIYCYIILSHLVDLCKSYVPYGIIVHKDSENRNKIISKRQKIAAKIVRRKTTS